MVSLRKRGGLISRGGGLSTKQEEDMNMCKKCKEGIPEGGAVKYEPSSLLWGHPHPFHPECYSAMMSEKEMASAQACESLTHIATLAGTVH